MKASLIHVGDQSFDPTHVGYVGLNKISDNEVYVNVDLAPGGFHNPRVVSFKMPSEEKAKELIQQVRLAYEMAFRERQTMEKLKMMFHKAWSELPEDVRKDEAHRKIEAVWFQV